MKKVGMILGGVLVLLLAAVLIGGWTMFGTQIRAAGTVRQLEDGLYCMEYQGDYGLDDFLDQGGAADSAALADYLTEFLSHGFWKQESAPQTGDFGCSTLTVRAPEGGVLFGRNYDWESCTAMLVHTAPEEGYASVSTVCLDFLGFGADWVPDDGMMNRMLALAAVYVPLDGMNEMGLCVADLMAGDGAETHQNTEKPDLTTTTALRLMLDRAATVDEAVALLEQYDMNSDIGTAHHFALSDASGKSVVAEYVDGALRVTETPVVTNHYLTAEKLGVGSEESHDRFDVLFRRLQEAGGAMTPAEVRDSLQAVAQSNYPSEDNTEWSLVFDTQAQTAEFYRNERYGEPYRLSLAGGAEWLTEP